jgi:hypothetical protein
MSGTSDRSRNRCFRRSKTVRVVRGGLEPPTFRFSGALSPRDHSSESFQKPSSPHYRWSAGVLAIIATMPPSTHSSVSSVGFLWGLRPAADLWGNCGPRGSTGRGAGRLDVIGSGDVPLAFPGWAGAGCGGQNGGPVGPAEGRHRRCRCSQARSRRCQIPKDHAAGRHRRRRRTRFGRRAIGPSNARAMSRSMHGAC